MTCQVLVETLKVNRSVSSIYLAQAEITDTGVKATDVRVRPAPCGDRSSAVGTDIGARRLPKC